MMWHLSTKASIMKSDTEVLAEYRLRLFRMALWYNALIILAMCGLFYYFENGWPVLMLLLMTSVETKDDNRKGNLQ